MKAKFKPVNETLTKINAIKEELENIKDNCSSENIILLDRISSILTECSKSNGLGFNKFKEPAEIELENGIPVIKNIEELNISKNVNKKNNIIVEGENLHCLSILSKTHKNKINIIYIDPPYNCNGFTYGDTFVDTEDPFTDSKWVSFMRVRLENAKKLLSKDGVILVSIDDTEQANLRKIMDSIFGKDNLIGCLIWDKGISTTLTKNMQKNHEYIFAYAKSKKYFDQKNEPILSVEKEKNIVVYEDIFTGKSFVYMSNNGGTGHNNRLIDCPSCGYTIYYKEVLSEDDKNFVVSIDAAKKINKKYGSFKYYISKDNKKFVHAVAVKDYNKLAINVNASEEDVYNDELDLISNGYIPIRPPKRNSVLGCWSWGLNTFKELWNKNEVLFEKKSRSDDFHVKRIRFLSKNEFKKIEIVQNKKIIKTYTRQPIESIFKISSQNGPKDLSSVLGKSDFPHPKPVDLIKFLIKSYNKKDAVILDFFAGSGTTAQAVLELNQEDNGNRTFILCDNNEIDDKEKMRLLKDVLGNKPSRKAFKDLSDEEFDKKLEDYEISKSELLETEVFKNEGICRKILYGRVKTLITGIRPNGSVYSKGMNANVAYYICDVVSKEQDFLSDELIDSSIELAYIENMVCKKSSDIFVVSCEEDFDEAIKSVSKKIYVPYDILPTFSQEEMLKEKELIFVPENFYKEI